MVFNRSEARSQKYRQLGSSTRTRISNKTRLIWREVTHQKSDFNPGPYVPYTIKARLNGWFKPSSNFLADRSKAVLLLWILFVICVSCVSVILSCLFLAALWLPAMKGLTFWLLSM